MTETKQDRHAALDTIAGLARDHDISPAEINRYIGQTGHENQASLASKLLAYLGGIFVLAGICIFTGMQWEHMSSLQRVITTLGSGLAAFILALLTGRDSRYEKATLPLFLIAATFQTGGLFVVLDEYFPASPEPLNAVIAIFSVMLLQQVITLAQTRYPVLIFLSLFFWTGLIGTVFERLDIAGEVNACITGLSLLLLSYTTACRGHDIIAAFWYFIGGAAFLGGTFAWLEDTAFDPAYLGINAFFIFLSLRLASRSLLCVSVLGLLGYLSYFTNEYFANVVGWPIALIVMGLVMIGLSSYAIKLGRNIKHTESRSD